jgi:23S rRNA (uracil1939-C5)-methyltransferase
VYRGYLKSRVETALAQHDLTSEIREPHLSPPRTRRRATLRAVKVGQGVVLGFNAVKSHRVVDLRECHILKPELFALAEPLRALLSGLLPPRKSAEIQLTLTDQGPDVLLKGVDADAEGLSAIERLTAFAAAERLARLSLDRGLGAETVYEPQPATITLSGKLVRFPVGGFLQATQDGEAALVEAVREAAGDAQNIADLFAGLGTFALATRASYAAEASRDAAAAVTQAAPQLRVDHRDLYRRPLDKDELRPFDAVILDPPRAGAEEQVKNLAGSNVSRIAYVSCNPATFAHDARILVNGGYALAWIRPVGQFRWSTHVELAAAFVRV